MHWLREERKYFLDEAAIAALLGERERAVELLKRHSQEAPQPFLRTLHSRSAFDSLRTYEPFMELIRPKG